MPEQEQAKSSEGGGGKRGREETQPACGDVAGQQATTTTQQATTTTQQASPTPEAGGPVKRRPGRPSKNLPGTKEERYRERQQIARAQDAALDESKKEKHRKTMADRRAADKAAGKKLSQTATLTEAQKVIKEARKNVRLDEHNIPHIVDAVKNQKAGRLSLLEIRKKLDTFMAHAEQERRTRPALIRKRDDAFLRQVALEEGGTVPHSLSDAYRKAEADALCVFADCLRRLRKKLRLDETANASDWEAVGNLFRRYTEEEGVDRDALWKAMVAHSRA